MSIDKSLSEDVGISSINDGHGGAAVIFSACSSQSDVVTGVEDNLSLRKDSVVFNLSLADSRAVVGKDDKFGLSVSKSPKCRFVSKDVLSTLNDQTQLAIDVFSSLFLHHFVVIN